MLEPLLLLLDVLHGELLGLRSHISPDTDGGDSLPCLLYDQGPLPSVGDVDANLLVVSYTTDLERDLNGGILVRRAPYIYLRVNRNRVSNIQFRDENISSYMLLQGPNHSSHHLDR